MRFEGKDFQEAAKVFELRRKAEPYESMWLVELVKVYQQTNSTSKLMEVLIDLAPIEADNLEVRRTLAKLLGEAGRHADRRFRRCNRLCAQDAQRHRGTG